MLQFIKVVLVALLLSSFAFVSTSSADDFLACESKDGKRNYCRVGGAENSEIRLSKQMSDSSCQEGSSWGRDDYGVWVDRGCRAEFRVIRKQETCPSGFRPGRCGDNERRSGCKDMRLPGGLGCRSA